MGVSAPIGRQLDAPAHGVAREEADVDPVADGGLQMAEHLDGVILIVAHGEKPLRAPKPAGVGMGVAVRDIGDVVALGFEPVGKGELPQKPFARSGAQGCVQDLTILAVRTIEADLHVTAPPPFMSAVVIKGELVGPAVVGLPGVVRALKDQVGAAVIAHDEDDVALHPFAFGRELAEIDAAGPVRRNFQRGARLPLTIAQALGADGRVGLHCTRERPERREVTSSGPAVEAHAIHVESERGRRIGADEELDAIARPHAGVRTVTFNPWTTILGGWIDSRVLQRPVARSRFLVLAADEIRPGSFAP